MFPRSYVSQGIGRLRNPWRMTVRTAMRNSCPGPYGAIPRRLGSSSNDINRGWSESLFRFSGTPMKRSTWLRTPSSRFTRTSDAFRGSRPFTPGFIGSRSTFQSIGQGPGKERRRLALTPHPMNPGMTIPSISRINPPVPANQAIDQLPPKHRQAVLLREIEGLSYQEIAEVAGCSVGTVMSRIHYARERLKEKIRSFAPEVGSDG